MGTSYKEVFSGFCLTRKDVLKDRVSVVVIPALSARKGAQEGIPAQIRGQNQAPARPLHTHDLWIHLENDLERHDQVSILACNVPEFRVEIMTVAFVMECLLCIRHGDCIVVAAHEQVLIRGPQGAQGQ